MNQTIKAGKRSFNIYHFTGKVASATKNMETKVSGSGGGGGSYQGTGYNAPVRITSTTIVHDQLFIVDKEGQEQALQLQGFNLACREGNIVTASWAVQEGAEEGPYFAITNHSTNQQFINEAVVKKIVSFGTKKGNVLSGCLILLAIFAVVIYLGIKFPIVFIAAIGYVVYFNFVTLPAWIKSFKSSVEYPKPELW